MQIKDFANIFERVYSGMNVLCGDGTLAERHESVLLIILPLRVEEFPEAMRDDFNAIKATSESGTTDEVCNRFSKNYLKLYTKAARLSGPFQDIIGGSSLD